jgi:hypothetical protein
MQVEISLQEPHEAFWTINILYSIALEAKLSHLMMIKLGLNDRTRNEEEAPLPESWEGQQWVLSDETMY